MAVRFILFIDYISYDLIQSHSRNKKTETKAAMLFLIERFGYLISAVAVDWTLPWDG